MLDEQLRKLKAQLAKAAPPALPRVVEAGGGGTAAGADPAPQVEFESSDYEPRRRQARGSRAASKKTSSESVSEAVEAQQDIQEAITDDLLGMAKRYPYLRHAACPVFCVLFYSILGRLLFPMGRHGTSLARLEQAVRAGWCGLVRAVAGSSSSRWS